MRYTDIKCPSCREYLGVEVGNEYWSLVRNLRISDRDPNSGAFCRCVCGNYVTDADHDCEPLRVYLAEQMLIGALSGV